MLSGGGPDAYDVACVCQTCNGHGLVSCERTHLLPGWQTSKGANLEVLNSLVLGNAITLEPGAEPVKPAAVLEFLGKLFDLDMIDLNGSLK